MRILLVTLALLTISSCADDRKNYDAMARCNGLGLKSGTKEYDSCVSQETTNELMKQQREEYEMQKQWDQDWKQRRY